MNELEFLKHIISEISSVNFGEGIQFNLRSLTGEINERITLLKNAANNGIFVDAAEFNKIKDLRPYLRLHPDCDMVTTSCLHFLGDEAQLWHAMKTKGLLETKEIPKVITPKFKFPDTWIEITDENENKRLFIVSKMYSPIKTGNSLHAYEEQYVIENKTYRFLYAIGDEENPLIEQLEIRK
jgi:hypothetical protein